MQGIKAMLMIPLASLETFFMQLNVMASPPVLLSETDARMSDKIDAQEMVGTVLLAHNGNHEKCLL